MGKYLIAVLSIFSLFISCSTKEETKITDIPLGKYVYEDDESVIHGNENCIKLKYGKDRHGHSMYAKTPIDTLDLELVDRVCTMCVNTDIYEHLLSICRRNEEVNKCREWLYNKFTTDYEMGSYSTFVKDLSDITKRRKLYEAACSEGWEVGNFDEFSKLLGFENTLTGRYYNRRSIRGREKTTKKPRHAPYSHGDGRSGRGRRYLDGSYDQH